MNLDLKYDALSNSFCGSSWYSDRLVQVMWHITNSCILNCKFCFSKFLRKDSSELSVDLVNKNISLFKKLGVLKLDISGGEPLLVDLLPYIIEKCEEAGIALTITSSGSGTAENVKWIESNWQKFSRIILSLDGPKEVHNTLRGSNLAYQNFYDLYYSLRDCGCDRIRINTVVTKPLVENSDTFLDLILAFAPKEWCCIEPHPANKICTFDEVATSNLSFLQFVDKCENRFINTKTDFVYRTIKDYSSYWTLYPNQLLCHLSELETFDYSVCFSEENLYGIEKAIKRFPQYCIKRKDESSDVET